MNTKTLNCPVQEWSKSGVSEDIIRLNTITLSGENAYEYLLFGLTEQDRRNDGRLNDRWLRKYRHIEDGGWWCSGVDILTGEDSQWGCFKPNKPRTPHGKKDPIKYETPPLVPTEVFALKVPDSTWQEIADRFGVVKSGSSFWQWVKDNPRIPILLTEGAKKAGALLSAGYCAIALPGINNGYRRIDDERFLIPQLKTLCSPNREWIIVFDSDKKFKTQQAVINSTQVTGSLLKTEGCQASVIAWHPEKGKGIDDVLTAHGIDYFETMFDERLYLSDYKRMKRPKIPTLTIGELKHLLECDFEDRLSYDLLMDEILLDGKPITSDEVWTLILNEYQYEASLRKLPILLSDLAKKNSFHPVERYLRQCLSVGQRVDIGNLASRYFGTDDPLYDSMLKRWLIGCVARVFNPGCKFDNALILQGRQDFGKSYFFNILGGEFFCESIDISQDVNNYLNLHSAWIHELGEFDEITSRREAGAIKRFLTKQSDKYRKPYDRDTKDHPRQCAFAGSVNELSFLIDKTGNRRFWIVPIPRSLPDLNVKQLKAERDGIWAAAVDAYLRGESWQMSDEEKRANNANNEQFEVYDDWEAEIQAYAEKHKVFTSADILVHVMGIEIGRQEQKLQRRVAGIFTKLGYYKSGTIDSQGTRRQAWCNTQETYLALRRKNAKQNSEILSNFRSSDRESCEPSSDKDYTVRSEVSSIRSDRSSDREVSDRNRSDIPVPIGSDRQSDRRNDPFPETLSEDPNPGSIGRSETDAEKTFAKHKNTPYRVTHTNKLQENTTKEEDRDIANPYGFKIGDRVVNVLTNTRGKIVRFENEQAVYYTEEFGEVKYPTDLLKPDRGQTYSFQKPKSKGFGKPKNK